MGDSQIAASGSPRLHKLRGQYGVPHRVLNKNHVEQLPLEGSGVIVSTE